MVTWNIAANPLLCVLNVLFNRATIFQLAEGEQGWNGPRKQKHSIYMFSDKSRHPYFTLIYHPENTTSRTGFHIYTVKIFSHDTHCTFSFGISLAADMQQGTWLGALGKKIERNFFCFLWASKLGIPKGGKLFIYFSIFIPCKLFWKPRAAIIISFLSAQWTWKRTKMAKTQKYIFQVWLQFGHTSY